MNSETASDHKPVRLTGPLTAKTVPELFNRRMDFQRSPQLDLKNVVKIDSAGLALLIYWHNLAREQSVQLEYKDVPPRLKELAGLCSVEFLFNAEASLEN